MKKWSDITEKYLNNMPMNFLVRTGVSNDEWYQAIRRVPYGWIFYAIDQNRGIVEGVFVPEVKQK